ncbi:hypothetical protein M6B22_07195 [Jatrophihabitans cynanchi]|uniref:Secreted protein n=1 Tax=Jatrophihabitans cynanchi TaxID=2944128 RepID=A0ABY7K149_9ACTN|nr:hypothetical protein [Jatrophihabitans sp. SB3-54]WAX58542.1 hypothetical protein M6B22_07195 [Jatrophihabitans sp. SB3-54]
MAKFVVNIVLLAAVLLLLIVWGIAAARRRRQARREHREDRRLLLAAISGAAPATALDEDDPLDDEDDDVPGERQSRARATRRGPAGRTGSAAVQQLDAESLAALLDLLEDRRPARRGLVAGLFTSPRSVWSAGTRAGQKVARRTIGQPGGAEQPSGESALYRDAAAELVDIHANDPADARRKYAHFAAAVADPTLAALYVRSAAYASYADQDEVRAVVTEITSPAPTGSPRGSREELLDGAGNIDT